MLGEALSASGESRKHAEGSLSARQGEEERLRAENVRLHSRLRQLHDESHRAADERARGILELATVADRRDEIAEALAEVEEERDAAAAAAAAAVTAEAEARAERDAEVDARSDAEAAVVAESARACSGYSVRRYRCSSINILAVQTWLCKFVVPVSVSVSLVIM